MVVLVWGGLEGRVVYSAGTHRFVHAVESSSNPLQRFACPHATPSFAGRPEASLHAVAQKFLADLEVDSDETRKAVVSFIPAAFASVGAMAKHFYAVERRCGGPVQLSATRPVHCRKHGWQCMHWTAPHACHALASCHTF